MRIQGMHVCFDLSQVSDLSGALCERQVFVATFRVARISFTNSKTLVGWLVGRCRDRP